MNNKAVLQLTKAWLIAVEQGALDKVKRFIDEELNGWVTRLR